VTIVKSNRTNPQPEPYDLRTADLFRHVVGVKLIHWLPWAKLPMRWFFKQCPRVYMAGPRLKSQVVTSGLVREALDSADRCCAMAETAETRSYFEDAGAMRITCALLALTTYSIQMAHHTKEISGAEFKRIFLRAFQQLSHIRSLPQENLSFWRDRCAEVIAGLLVHVAGYEHKGSDRIQALAAVSAVGQLAVEMLPIGTIEKVEMPAVAHYYMGSPARVPASVGHLELIAGLRGQAFKRIEALLESKLEVREDLLYALMIGLAASDDIEEANTHSIMLERLHSTIDSARERYQSTEGRLNEMQHVFHDIRYALEIWAIDVHRAADLLTVVDALKARLLLDDLAGIHAPIQELSSEHEDGANVESASEEPTYEDDITASQAAQLRVLSFVPSAGTAGFESSNPAIWYENTALKEKFAELDRKILARTDQPIGSVRPYSTKQIQAALEEGELLLEFFIPRDPFRPNRECRIIALDRHGCEHRGLYIDSPGRIQHSNELGLLERGPLSDMAAFARAAILERDDPEAKRWLSILFNYLIQPVIQMGHKPENYRRWIIIAHGPLHLIPMHALVDNDGRFLIERVPVTTAPSSSVWLRMLERPSSRPQRPRMLAVGNPASSPHLGIPNLPYAEEEVSGLRDPLTAGYDCDVFVGEAASLDAVRRHMPAASLIHFAAHGGLDLREPLHGQWIHLRQLGNENGLLSGREVREMDLHRASVVYLDICNGAVCRYGAGDEPLGLLAAFIVAGAENVLGGLWPLYDEPSKEFAIEFYGALKGADPAVARQTAAVSMIRKEYDLVFWAGIELVGSARLRLAGDQSETK
jgi:CHAT domain-containing protein